MKKWIVKFNNKGMEFTSEYSRSLFLDYRKKNINEEYDLIPKKEEPTKGRRFMEGAVIRAYCQWQYGIDGREPGRSTQRRNLFMQDFCYEIVEGRNKNPVRMAKSSKGEANKILETYTRYAEENGAPIPNPALFNLWKNKWKSSRFPTFFDFLDFLKIECDAMPSKETLDLLGDEPKVNYPENKLGESLL